MKKITVYTLLIITALILAACGGGAVAEEPEVPAETDAPAATEAPAESVKPPLPTQQMGPQLPEGHQDLKCNINGYIELVVGDVIGMADNNGTDIAEFEIIGDNLVFTSLATGNTHAVLIQYGDQSTVNFAYLTIPIDLGNNQTGYAEFLLVTCGNHVYIPVR